MQLYFALPPSVVFGCCGVVLLLSSGLFLHSSSTGACTQFYLALAASVLSSGCGAILCSLVLSILFGC